MPEKDDKVLVDVENSDPDKLNNPLINPKAHNVLTV